MSESDSPTPPMELKAARNHEINTSNAHELQCWVMVLMSVNFLCVVMKSWTYAFLLLATIDRV